MEYFNLLSRFSAGKYLNKAIVTYLNYYLDIYLEILRAIVKESVRIDSNPAAIRTVYILNKTSDTIRT
jgi:hypothetical protein